MTFVMSNNDGAEKQTAATGVVVVVEEEEEEDTSVLARTSKEKSNFAMFLNTSKAIERIIKHTNVLYMCSEEQWQRKINNYLEQTSIFSFIGDLTTSATSSNAAAAVAIEEILMKMSNLVVKTLHQLLYRKAITNEQYSDMMYYNQSIQFEVNKLDFIPKIRSNKIVIQPMIKCSIVEPMKGILNLVNDLLQPLIEDKFHSKTFPTANEATEALIKYTEKHYLRVTSYFVTIHIHDLHSTLPHDLIIHALEHFFRYYQYDKLPFDGIVTTTTIIQLIELFLKNQYCLYDDTKLYQQILGSSIDSPLITTLIDIYLFYWQYDILLRLPCLRERFFGRCHNQIFFIWNDSKDELFTFLNQKFTNSAQDEIQRTVTIDYKIQYLDAEISHIQGCLQTRVYHYSNFEPYALPYLSKIKSTSSSQDILVLLRAALVRAILYCSNLGEFENERLYIELSFLLNDVSLYLIEKIMENFFIEFRIMKREMLFIDEDTYRILRSNIRENYQQQSKYHIRQKERQLEQWRWWQWWEC